jgi:hypothetical protein
MAPACRRVSRSRLAGMGGAGLRESHSVR